MIQVQSQGGRTIIIKLHIIRQWLIEGGKIGSSVLQLGPLHTIFFLLLFPPGTDAKGPMRASQR